MGSPLGFGAEDCVGRPLGGGGCLGWLFLDLFHVFGVWFGLVFMVWKLQERRTKRAGKGWVSGSSSRAFLEPRLK